VVWVTSLSPDGVVRGRKPHIMARDSVRGATAGTFSGLRVSNRFATTQWNVVLTARDGSDTQARRALEALCESYWYPLYAYVRRRGHSADESADLTQAFFTDLLGRDFLGAIDRSKGRFRSFLLASLEHFLSHERERAQSLKKGGGVQPLSLDAQEAESRYQLEPQDWRTPEMLFERRWGLTVLERAMNRLRAEFADQPERFERLKPSLTGAEHDQYREVASALGMSETAVKAAVHRMRQRYGRLLRDEIAETVSDPGQVDDEVRHLLGVIQPWRDPEA
jgi:RNA polymerase sigma-70 factor (ECF subfamily)